MSEAPTTLHARVAATDPAPSRQGPPAFRPGNPTWDAGYETARLQSAGIADAMRAYLAEHLMIDSSATAEVVEMIATILAMRPKPPIGPNRPVSEDGCP